MAKKSRNCDRCGAKASPWIPRARSGSGEQMLCAGCKNSDTSQKTAELDPVPDRKPAGSAVRDADFGWENGLAPEGYHPLAAPLPKEVWERFAQKQALRGKPLVPMDAQKVINARMRGEDGGQQVTSSLLVQGGAQEDGAYSGKIKGGPSLIQHLQEHHGIAPAPAHIMGHSASEHAKLHDAGADHTHGPDGEAVPKAVATGQSEPGKDKVKHPSSMGTAGMHTHLTVHHGISQQEIDNATQGASTSIHQSAIQHALHNHAHSLGFGTDNHTHEGWSNKDFTHQTPSSHEEYIAHLKHSHGLSDEDLAETKSSFGGGHKLAEKMHDDLHSHSTWDHEHTGHKDVGKPFVGVDGDTASGGSVGAHLKAHHGHTNADIESLVQGLGGIAGQNALKAHHGNLHKVQGPVLDHQHVPTTQPDVKSPEVVAKEKMHQHLIDEHGYKPGMIGGSGDFEHKAAHEPGAYGYKGHPGHEHGDSSDPTHMTVSLPHTHQNGEASDHPFHHAHASEMSHDNLAMHLVDGHGHDFDDMMDGPHKSKDELLQMHAQSHATGGGSTHTHEPSQSGLGTFGDKLYGGAEPEPQHDTHASPGSESEALAHIIQHHPNISAEHYKVSGHTSSATKMQDFHAKLHAPDGGFPSAPDGHDHAPAQGPSTAIPVGSHLVSHHGMTQEQVAAMSPKEFKAHHEELHARHDELDLGHGHEFPGGPVRGPRSVTPNLHHAEMRSDPDHPAVHEWYHGTANSYDGPPKSATNLMEDHSFWGNWGGGDWNNHAGTHWTSLHQMAKEFSRGPDSRVIHAKLHMRNPITYNSLNHMSHDAYDRLHASGDMQDGGHYLNNHSDDSGYNHCCSDALLEYAKGGHRSDGKYGMERYRDSLRASGHDGIVVRNQADSPEGHWNAIPLSSDQIEITHASCQRMHGDERDFDNNEFNANKRKLTQGWQHPKKFDAKDYTGGKELPTKDEVDDANEAKYTKPEMPHVRAGRGTRRGDADPLRNGRDLISLPELKTPGSAHGEDDEDEEECEACGQSGHDKSECTELYCHHCDEHTNHESEDCDQKWCHVCEENGDHEAADDHPYCSHCDDYTDHDSDDHEDEWGEHPDKIRPEGYCPSCEANTKNNYGKKECAECGEELPDHGKLVANSKPVAAGKYQKDGETDEANFGHASEAPLHVSPTTSESKLAAHLYHHHKSDVSGKEFEDGDGGWDSGKLEYHHQHLHADPGWAKSEGFEMNHEHPAMFGGYKPHEAMTPAEVHAHLMLAHSGQQAGAHGGVDAATLLSMTPEEAVEHHKKAHAADDAIPWGQKDEDGDLIAKIKHHHQAPADKPTNAPDETSPHGDDLVQHIHAVHKLPGITNPKFKQALGHPGTMEALHQHLHDAQTNGADPSHEDYHTHAASGGGEAGAKQKMLDHLAEHHGIGEGHAFHEQYKKMNGAELMKAHTQEHDSLFPMGSHPEHGHSSSNPHVPGWMDTQQKQASLRTLTDYFSEVTA